MKQEEEEASVMIMSSSSCQDGNSNSNSNSNSRTTEKEKKRRSVVVVAAASMLLLLGAAAVVAVLIIPPAGQQRQQQQQQHPSKQWSSSRLGFVTDATVNNAAATADRRGDVGRWLSSSWSSSRFQSNDAADDSTRTQPTTTATRPAVVATRNGSFQVLDKIAHDATAFTQGLQMVNATHYYESLGLYGQSAVRLVELDTATTILQTNLGPQWFGEGLCQYTTVNNNNNGQEAVNRLIQITWQEQDAFIYNADTLQQLQRLSYATLTSNGEGWGITWDTSSNKNCLYVSDGSEYLHAWNVPNATSPELKEIANRVAVYRTLDDNGIVQIPVRNLNELEYDPYAAANGGGGRADGGTLLANIWQYDMIVRINPETGHVTTLYDMATLYPHSERPQSADVLNGIAAIPDHPNEYWITGKKWPYMFRIRLVD
jgi:glutaminyl-peptide cyclotransferase